MSREIPGRQEILKPAQERSVGNYQAFSRGSEDTLTVTLLPAIPKKGETFDTNKLEITVTIFDKAGTLLPAEKGTYRLKVSDASGLTRVLKLTPQGNGSLKSPFPNDMVSAIKKTPTISLVSSGFETLFQNRGWAGGRK